MNPPIVPLSTADISLLVAAMQFWTDEFGPHAAEAARPYFTDESRPSDIKPQELLSRLHELEVTVAIERSMDTHERRLRIIDPNSVPRLVLGDAERVVSLITLDTRSHRPTAA